MEALVHTFPPVSTSGIIFSATPFREPPKIRSNK
uniref:Photosystem II protein T n=1 Tax=Selaginella vardei TaxID=189576 RepID=A0A410KKQ5_9TRAC|nr:photosystem II protein T [Selaginella vardei]QAR48777.1 photosystem II protein T [Selaginella vardei]